MKYSYIGTSSKQNNQIRIKQNYVKRIKTSEIAFMIWNKEGMKKVLLKFIERQRWEIYFCAKLKNK